MKTILLSVVIAMTSVANAISSNNLNGFAYNSEMNGNRMETKTVYKVENEKYLKNHLQYNYAYNADGRVSAKEVLKWNVDKACFEKQYCLNFKYDNAEVSIEYALWNSKDNAYSEVKSKAIYQVNGDVVNYQSYEWNKKENNWNLTANHSTYKEDIKLLAYK